MKRVRMRKMIRERRKSKNKEKEKEVNRKTGKENEKR